MDNVAESGRSGRSRDATLMVIGAIVVLVLTALYVWAIMYKPAYSGDRTANSAVTTSSTSGGKAVTVHLAIQQQVGTGPHADWLGYQTEGSTPHPGTVMSLPRNTLVTIIIHNFDSATPPRNPYFSLVQGTVGGVEYVNGKKVRVLDPSVMSHTFTIPDFAVSVPMMGIPSNAKPNAFETMKFTFRTPNRTGVFRWQCIVPCGSGLYGNGGPMSEIGYMQGLITLT